MQGHLVEIAFLVPEVFGFDPRDVVDWCFMGEMVVVRG